MQPALDTQIKVNFVCVCVCVWGLLWEEGYEARDEDDDDEDYGEKMKMMMVVE